MDWPAAAHPRRAGVSSFGIGGTNVHVVLEQPPAPPARPPRPPAALPLVVSARTPAALADAVRDLAAWTRRERPDDLTDLAATLAGRRAHPHRAAVVCRDGADAARLLAGAATEAAHQGREAVFLFPGQGTAPAATSRALYAGRPAYRAHFDACAELLGRRPADLHAAADGPARPERDTRLLQPTLFALEYALAATLMDWGLRPAAMLGHSLGEYVAATLAGVLSLPDALTLVEARAAVQHRLPAGRMLAVPLAAEDLRPLLADGVELAALNAPDRCVVSGAPEPVRALAALLAERGVATTALATAHAFHSAAVEPLLDDFRAALQTVELRPPRLRYCSGLTGDWADETVASPDHWLAHMRRPVRFADGLRRCLELGPVALLETGPPAGLTALARRAPGFGERHRAIRCLAGTDPAQSLTRAVAEAWRAGCDTDWPAFHRPAEPRRTTVPGYPFQRARHWVEPDAASAVAGRSGPAASVSRVPLTRPRGRPPAWRPPVGRVRLRGLHGRRGRPRGLPRGWALASWLSGVSRVWCRMPGRRLVAVAYRVMIRPPAGRVRLLVPYGRRGPPRARAPSSRYRPLVAAAHRAMTPTPARRPPSPSSPASPPPCARSYGRPATGPCPSTGGPVCGPP
ncbi:acyltransferase domain-containing protein [Streptomyces stramineus]